MYYSRPFKTEHQPPTGRPFHNSSTFNGDQRYQHGPSQEYTPNSRNSGHHLQEPVSSGMLNNFSKALGLGNSPRPSPITEQHNQMSYNLPNRNSMQPHSNYTNKMMMQLPQYNNRNPMDYNSQQQPMHSMQQQQQQQQQRGVQPQGYQHQQNMMQPQHQNQPFRGQMQQQQQQPNMMMGGYHQQQNHPQAQQQGGMYNSSSGMYNNHPQQPMGRQQQGYLNQPNSGNYQQQGSLVVPANQGRPPMGMQQQRMSHQQHPNMMMPHHQQQQQQQPHMMMSSQHQPMMTHQQPQSMVGRYAPSYDQQHPTQYPYDPHPHLQQQQQQQLATYGNPQGPMMQQQQLPPIVHQAAPPSYTYQTNQPITLQPSQPVHTVQSLQPSYVVTSVGAPVQPTTGIVVAAPQMPTAPPPQSHQPTIAYVSQSSILPQAQATVLNPLNSTTTTSYLAVPQSQATIQLQPQQPQPQVVTAGQPGSFLIQQAGQPITLTQQQQPTSLIVSAGPPPAPTITTDQLQAAAAAAAAAAIGLPNQSSLGHGLLDPATLNPQQQHLFQQLQLQHQAQQLKKMRQRLPHVSGDELRTLQKQMSDLQQMQQMQQLQTLRLAQKQEQQTFKYLNKAIKNRPNRTYQSRFTKTQPSICPTNVMYPRDTARITSAALLGGAALGSTVGTPDTLSETGSMRSRSRRALPYLPTEEPALLPFQVKKAHERIRTFRHSSLDGLTNGRGTSLSGGLFSRPKPSSSESNLRKLALGDFVARPGSALGLLQASSVVSSHGPTSATREHEKRILENILPPDLKHLVRGGSPATIQQMKNKLEEDMRINSDSSIREGDVARRNAERRLFGGSLGSQTERIRQEMLRYASLRDPVLRAKMKHNLNPVMNAQLDRNRRLRTHRRNLSDPRFSSSYTDSLVEDDPFLYNRPYSALARDYDPLSDGLGMDNSRSYLGGRSLSGPDGISSLRDTAINSNLDYDVDRNRYLASRSRQLLRRSSDGGLGVLDPLGTRSFDVGLNSSPLTARRAQSSMSGRYPRSWHPSPFASDDEASSDEPQFFKDEKKNRIKMEIAKRRQQIEENACLHDELTRLARLRETAEMSDRLHPSVGVNPHQPGILYNSSPGMYNHISAGTSVLKSVDEILRDGHHPNDIGGYPLRTNHYQPTSATRYGRTYDNLYPEQHYNMTGVHPSANTVGYSGDMYTGSGYDRVTDFSPYHPETHTMSSRHHYDMDPYTHSAGGGRYHQKYASYK